VRRRGLVSNLYRTARLANDVSVIASGNPHRIARRAKNKIVLRRVAAALLIACAGVVTACGGGSAPAFGQPVSAAATTSSTGSEADAGIALCAAIHDLASVHDNQGAAMITTLDTVMAQGNYPLSSADHDQVEAGLTAIASVFTKHAGELRGLRSQTFANLVVTTDNAYSGYDSGALAIQKVMENPPNTVINFGQAIGPGLNWLNSGQQALSDAVDLLQMLDATGILVCPD
jgi:hypothetical protein